MIPLDVTFREPAWPELADKPVIATEQMKVAVLDRGTTSGRPSVALRIDLPDGQVIIAQTTARLFCTAARMIMGRYPDLFEGD